MAAAMIKTIRRNAKTHSLKLAGANSFGDDGFATEASTSSANIEAVVQPMEFKDLRNVPEGQNTLQWVSIWSESNIPEKAEIVSGGATFTIQRTQFWEAGGFYKAAAVHLED